MSKILTPHQAGPIALETQVWGPACGWGLGLPLELCCIPEPEFLDLPLNLHPGGPGQANLKPSFDLSFILSCLAKSQPLFSACPPLNYSAASLAARPETDLVQPKGRHGMCISDELPEERINNLTWDGKERWLRHHVTDSPLARTSPVAGLC